MHKRNENLTKAYSPRVRSRPISAPNRTQGECTDNYYQAVCCFAHTAPLLHEVYHVHPMRPLHPMHHVHQCTTFTTRRAADATQQ